MSSVDVPRQATFDGDVLYPVPVIDGEVLLTNEKLAKRQADYLTWKLHGMPYGGIDWTQGPGFELRDAIVRTTKIAIVEALDHG